MSQEGSGDLRAGREAEREAERATRLLRRQPTLPSAIELAWGLRARPRRGPKPGLSLDRIVAAGIKVALTDGIGAVSMARVASELGVGTMSLYRYVGAKDELVVLMFDAAVGPPPVLDRAPGDWRAGLTEWTRGVRAAYHRHPWALRVPIGAPPLGPNNIAWLEAALEMLGATPLSGSEMLSTVLLLSFFARSEATLSADIAASGGADTSGYAATLRVLTGSDHFPALHRLIETGVFEGSGDRDAYFNYGLGRILDGVEKLAGARAASPPDEPRAPG